MAKRDEIVSYAVDFCLASKRIKSFCAAKPAQKLGWGDAGAGVVGGQELYGNFR
jgi:hypothetical protein